MFENILNKPSIEELWLKRPLIISGPCSAETEHQIIETALRLKATNQVDMFRAGIWKPRTRPGHFEGVGTVGLEWLNHAKNLTGLPVIIEVATAKQVEEALKHGIDGFWLGARTTTNPFSVQEIADAMKGMKIPVWIKNPINPDIQLWIGAVERIQKAGIGHLGLIHRGFSAYGNSEFRNHPTWQLAIEMKRRFPDFPFLIDPSHICGSRTLLKSVTQNAIDLDYDGVILESHYRPHEAWTDAEQQLTPEKVSELLSQIIWRKEKIQSEEIYEKLERFRRIIDHLDDEILTLLSRRMAISEEIGGFKKENSLTILQTARWNQTLERLAELGKKSGLSQEFIHQYFNAIHMESIHHQDKIMND